MPSPMLLEHVFGSWAMMSFPMPLKRLLAFVFAPGVLSGRLVAFVVHVVEQRLELGRVEERSDGVLGHAPPWLFALHGHLVPWAWMAGPVAIPAQVDGLGHLVLRLQTDRNGLLVCHDGSFQYVSGGSGAVRSAMM